MPPPLRVTRPPPSSSTSGLVLRTLAVTASTMVTGLDPHRKVIRLPCATAATTIAEVQFAGVPVPTTRSGAPVGGGA